jgi:hypothetical protein
MRDLTSGHLIFRTLPIQRYGTWGNPPQDVNIINVRRIRAIVHAAFYPQRSAGPGGVHGSQGAAAGNTRAVIDVLNGTTTYHLAADTAAALAKAGYRVGLVGNTPYRQSTAVRYGTGAAIGAGRIARLFGVTAAPSASVSAGHVEILLGTGARVPAFTVASRHSPAPVVIPSTGAQGGAVTARGKSGIPCVN